MEEKKSQLDYFKARYGFQDDDIILLPYGSRVYGTQSDTSDYDFLCIMPANRKKDSGEEYRNGDLNIHLYNHMHFQDLLNRHKIQAMEGYFLPNHLLFNQRIRKEFTFNLDLGTLREEISSKSSNSFVKAKKKIDKEKDYYVGWKSLFHSLRLLDFGTQIARYGVIRDYGSMNHHWKDIKNANEYEWAYFKEKYQPIYNALATEFRKVAPKKGEKVY